MNSKRRGGSFEREVARILSLWWSGGRSDNVFYRSQSSGARATQRFKVKKETKFQCGDIAPSNSEGELLLSKWSIEVKTGYGSRRAIKDENKKTVKKVIDRWDILDILDSRQDNPILMTMWEQCKRNAELSNRKPVLIFRRNNRQSCIVMETGYFFSLKDWLGRFDVSFCSISDRLIVMALKDFLDWAISLPCLLQDGFI